MGVSQKDVEKFHNADNSEGLEESKRLVSEEEMPSKNPHGESPIDDVMNSGEYENDLDANYPIFHIQNTIKRHGVNKVYLVY